jgi:hypothetical protein
MTDAPDKSDLVTKKLTPEDTEFLTDWVKRGGLALTELAEHFCRFPGDVEVSLTLKMRSIGGGQFNFTFGDITASRKEIDKAFAQHEARKIEAKGMLH